MGSDHTALEWLLSETPPLLKGYQEVAMKPAPAFLHRSTLLEDAGGQYAQSMQLESRLKNNQGEIHPGQSFQHILLTAFSFLFLLVCLTMSAVATRLHSNSV